MASREVIEMANRWLSGAHQVKDLPPREAATLGRRHSLERCLWIRSMIAKDRTEVLGIPMFDSLKTEQRILLGFRRSRKMMMN